MLNRISQCICFRLMQPSRGKTYEPTHWIFTLLHKHLYFSARRTYFIETQYPGDLVGYLWPNSCPTVRLHSWVKPLPLLSTIPVTPCKTYNSVNTCYYLASQRASIFHHYRSLLNPLKFVIKKQTDHWPVRPSYHCRCSSHLSSKLPLA